MNKINWLYGAIGGDIIGSAYEFNNVKKKDFELFRPESTFTDDTILTVATADAILTGKPYAEAYREWGRRYMQPKGGYGASFRAWLESDDQKPYYSWGNGAAMRVSPVGFILEKLPTLLWEAERSAECTHNHPDGIKGAQATAEAINIAYWYQNKAYIKYAMERYYYNLDTPLSDIRPTYKFSECAWDTVPVALIAFFESSSYEDAIRNAVSVGGDSDTIAAITGAVALAYYKDMPDYIVHEIERRLPDEMKAVCDKFNEYMENEK